MDWETKISKIENGKESVRGYDLLEIAKKKSFVEAVFLVLTGRFPKENETKMLNTLFTVAIDHGAGTPSAMTARITASAGNSLNTATASGILTMGKKHAGAIEGAAEFYQKNIDTDDLEALLKNMKEKGQRVPGYGHAVLEEDERSTLLFETAKDNNLYGKHCEFAEKTHKVLNSMSSKNLPLNIDGAMAAVISDMEVDWRLAKGFFMIARMPGLVAHAYEETEQGKMKRLSDSEIDYTGEEDRSI